MAARVIVWPFAGRNDEQAEADQPQFSTRAARNVRNRDPVTGRIRGASRSGLVKFNESAIGVGRIKALCSTAVDDRKVSFSFTAGQEDELWEVPTPSKGDCLGGATDRQGNVYAIDGNAGVVKYNSAGRELMKIALPTLDPGHVIRALTVDDSDRIFAGVSAGGDVATARVFCVLQLADNEYHIFWAMEPGAYTEELKVYRGSQLYCAHNYPLENRARVVVYESLSSDPVESQRVETVPYPLHGMDVIDGALYTTAPVGESTAANWHSRIGHPSSRGHHSPIEGWTPLDLEDARKRIWSWYDARDIDETDLEQLGVEAGLESGQQVLRWRDRSGNNRHWYSGGLGLGGTERGPTYLKVGPGGLPAVNFLNDANNLQSLATAGNVSIAKSMANQQLTAIPQYTGAMWAMFLLIRPTQDADAALLTPRLVFFADNEHATGSDHSLWVNRACGGVLPGTLTAGTVSYFATTDTTPDDGQCATADQSLAFNFSLWDSVVNAGSQTGCLLVTILWDGGVDPSGDPDVGGDAAKTRCIVRYNGEPTDRFEGLPFASLQPNRLGYANSATTVATVAARRFNGEVMAMMTLDRRNRFDDTTEPKVCTYDALEVGSAPADQTDTEIARIEAYFMYGRGLGRMLPSDANASSYPHFYGYTLFPGGVSATDAIGGPPEVTVGGLSEALTALNHNVPCATKHDLGTRQLKWVFSEDTYADLLDDRGGVGFAVRARKVESDSKTHVWRAGVEAEGPLAPGFPGQTDLRKIIDNGAAFADAQADGAWRHQFAGGAENGYEYPRMASDKFGNLYFPGHNLAGGTIRALHIFEKDPDGSGNAVQLTEFLFPSSASLAHGVALPPDALTPDYRTDLPDGPAERVYVFTKAEDPASDLFDSVHAVQLVNTTALATGSPRAVHTLAAVEDDIRRITASTNVVPTGGTAAISATSQYIQMLRAGEDIVILDGTRYLAYRLRDGTIEDLASTSAGEIPPRGRFAMFWRHRLVLALEGGKYAASRLGNIRDWNLNPGMNIAGVPLQTSTQAFTGTLTRAGEAEDSLVVMLPVSDDLAFLIGESKILRMTGDPQDGGNIHLVTDSMGGVPGDSVCKDQAGRVFMFGNKPRGLFQVLEEGRPRSLTEHSLEDTEFSEIDLATHRITLAWDPIDRGVRIYQIAWADPSTIVAAWFWEENTHRLVRVPPIWQDRINSADKQVTAVAYLGGDDTSALLVGCADGFVRMYDPAARDDDGTAIDSYVTVEVTPPGAADQAYMVTELTIVLADDQEGCRVELFSGETADVIGPILWSSDLKPGRNNLRMRVRGAHIWARLRNAKTGRWAFEEAQCELEPAGLVRSRQT